MNRDLVKKLILILAAAAAVTAAVFGILLWRAGSEASAAVDAYNAAAQAYNEQITPYNEAASRIAEANGDLQEVLDSAKGSLDRGAEAYEPKTREDLQKAVEEAQKALVDVPVQIEPFEMRSVTSSFHRSELDAQKARAQAAAAGVEEAEARIPPVPDVPDYSAQIKALEKSEKAYADSVQKLANVTAPPDSFVLERLRGIGSVVGAEAVTEKNDPNRLLGKKGGYIGCVYFLDSGVDRDLLPAEAFPDEEAGKAEDSEEPETTEESGEAEKKEDSEESEVSEKTEDPEESGGTGSSGSTGAEAAESSGTGQTAAAGAMEAAGTAGSSAGPAEEAPGAGSDQPRIDVVMIGAEGGGAVEIFATAEDAQKREDYLAFFEGSVMDPGAHTVEGTCVIRVSKHLSGDEQEKLTKKIREALLAVE